MGGTDRIRERRERRKRKKKEGEKVTMALTPFQGSRALFSQPFLGSNHHEKQKQEENNLNHEIKFLMKVCEERKRIER